MCGRTLRRGGLTLGFLTVAVGAYLFGAYSHSRNLWPLTLRSLGSATASANAGKFDEIGRLIALPSKTLVECPRQSDDTAVLLVAGQSNAGNHGARKFTTRFPGRVVNYFEGRCYAAASPLLGASGDEGEFATPLADDLIQGGAYKAVVVVETAVGGSPIARWQDGGDIGEIMRHTLEDAARRYALTQVVWVQGESDFINFTSTAVYARSFASMLTLLPPRVPVFVSIATRCGNAAQTGFIPLVLHPWKADNPVSAAQKQSIDNVRVFLGADSDRLLDDADRREDGCHLAEGGQIKIAAAYAAAIKEESRR